MLPLMEGCTILTGHQLWYKDRLAARFGLTVRADLPPGGLAGRETPPAPLPFGGELRLLDRSWAPWVYGHYSHAFGGVAYMEGAIDRGMLGAFVDGERAGFAGFHIEGAIGMLEVLPPFRRRGIGEALLRGDGTALALSRGQYAFGQVFTDNAPLPGPPAQGGHGGVGGNPVLAVLGGALDFATLSWYTWCCYSGIIRVTFSRLLSGGFRQSCRNISAAAKPTVVLVAFYNKKALGVRYLQAALEGAGYAGAHRLLQGLQLRPAQPHHRAGAGALPPGGGGRPSRCWWAFR